MTPDDIAHLLSLSDQVEERIGPEAAELVRRAAGEMEEKWRQEDNLRRLIERYDPALRPPPPWPFVEPDNDTLRRMYPYNS